MAAPRVWHACVITPYLELQEACHQWLGKRLTEYRLDTPQRINSNFFKLSTARLGIHVEVIPSSVEIISLILMPTSTGKQHYFMKQVKKICGNVGALALSTLRFPVLSRPSAVAQEV